MGLDNGIYITNITDNMAKNFPVECELGLDEDGTYIAYACYMRRWWGVRDEFVNLLDEKYGVTDGDIKLDIDDIGEFVAILHGWMNKERWNNDCTSPWDYSADNIEQRIVRIIEDCNDIITLMDNNPELEVYFYDSY